MQKPLPKDYEMLFALMKSLASKKGRVMRSEEKNTSHWVLVRSNSQKTSCILEEVVQLGMRSEFLKQKDDAEVVITATGVKTLKRVLSGSGALACPDNRPKPGKQKVASNKLCVNLSESPLAWLAKRKDKNGRPLLTDIQVLAGERLRADFTFASLMPDYSKGWKVETSGYARGSAKPSSNMRDDVLAARTRVQNLLDSLEPKCARVLVDVCCHLKGLEIVEAEQGWPQRSAKIVLQIALNTLAFEYGMIMQANASSRKIRVWESDPGTSH